MDTAAIFALISKGLALVPILIQAGAEIETIIANLKALSDSAQAGTVTDEQLNALEAELDAAIEQFNTPMAPPAA
jgi:hypothetical protein